MRQPVSQALKCLLGVGTTVGTGLDDPDVKIIQKASQRNQTYQTFEGSNNSSGVWIVSYASILAQFARFIPGDEQIHGVLYPIRDQRYTPSHVENKPVLISCWRTRRVSKDKLRKRLQWLSTKTGRSLCEGSNLCNEVDIGSRTKGPYG